MVFNISKTDQVLVLLNRLAVSENPSKLGSNERQCLLDPDDRDVERVSQTNSPNLDVEGQPFRRCSGTAKGPGTRRQSQDCKPAAALRIVLGDRRNSVASERKLRYHLLCVCPSRLSDRILLCADIGACLQVYKQLQDEALRPGKARSRCVAVCSTPLFSVHVMIDHAMS